MAYLPLSLPVEAWRSHQRPAASTGPGPGPDPPEHPTVVGAAVL